MAIKELVTRFGFEIDDKGLKELQEGIDAIKEGVLHLGELLIGEAVGLYELVEQASEAGVQLKIMTQEMGLAADKLQELQFRAKLADVSTEELNRSMNFLARNLEQARSGSEEARKHFKQLGISTAELRSGTVTVDSALSRMAKTFERMPDGPRKTALAMEVFGRGGARMVPFLNQLGDALDPVNKQILEMSMITEDQIEQSEHFHVSIETLKTAFIGIARVIGFGLMPVATKIVEEMKKWVVQNRAVIVQNLTGFVKGMAAALNVTLKIVDALVQAFAGFAHSIGGVEIATELLLGTMAVLSGVTVLFGIGKVVQAVITLAEAFGIANVAAAAIPIAIGAAMVAIFLIMEDIYSFFNGKKSFTGDLLKIMPQIGQLISSVFGPIFEPMVNIVTMLTDGFGTWTDIFKELGVVIINTFLAPLRAALGLASSFIGIMAPLTGLAGGSAISKVLTDFGTSNLALASPFSGGPGAIGPSAAVGSSPNNKQTNNQIALSQEFNFPPGTDPAVVGDKISSSVSSGLDDVLRQTQRSTSDGGAY